MLLFFGPRLSLTVKSWKSNCQYHLTLRLHRAVGNILYLGFVFSLRWWLTTVSTIACGFSFLKKFGFARVPSTSITGYGVAFSFFSIASLTHSTSPQRDEQQKEYTAYVNAQLFISWPNSVACEFNNFFASGMHCRPYST